MISQFLIYLKRIIMKLRKNSSFNWFTPFHVLIRPDVIWKKISRPLYHVHFTVIHTNSRHKFLETNTVQNWYISSIFFSMIPSQTFYRFIVRYRQYVTFRVKSLKIDKMVLPVTGTIILEPLDDNPVDVCHGPLIRYGKLQVAHASGKPGTFSLPPRVSDPDMHRVMHSEIAN